MIVRTAFAALLAGLILAPAQVAAQFCYECNFEAKNPCEGAVSGGHEQCSQPSPRECYTSGPSCGSGLLAALDVAPTGTHAAAGAIRLLALAAAAGDVRGCDGALLLRREEPARMRSLRASAARILI